MLSPEFIAYRFISNRGNSLSKNYNWLDLLTIVFTQRTKYIDMRTQDFIYKINTRIRRHVLGLFKPWYLKRYSSKSRVGSRGWLCEREHHYGGFVQGVKRNKVSQEDPRSSTELSSGGMMGGDRMAQFNHNYAPAYEKALAPLIGKSNIVVVEVGILTGIGLAMWSELFPDGSVFGLDIDLTHAQKNWANLESKGAFKNKNVILHEFDQYLTDTANIKKITQGQSIDFFIDDGAHRREPIMNTLAAAIDNMSPKFSYVVEDNATIYDEIVETYPELEVRRFGGLTLIQRN